MFLISKTTSLLDSDRSRLQRPLGRLSLLAAVFLLFFVAACTDQAGEPGSSTVGTSSSGTGAATSSASPDLGRVTAGIGIDPTMAPWVVAKELGAFEEVGLDFDYRVFEFSGLGLDAVIAGELDFAHNGEFPLLLAADKGAPPSVIAVIQESNQAFGLVGNSKVRDPEDLLRDDVTIGVTEGSSGQLYFVKYAEYFELDTDEMDVKNIAAPDLVASIIRGDIDAFFSWDPHLTLAVETAEDVEFVEFGEHDIFLQRNYMSFGRKVMENPEVAEAAAKAMLNTSKWLENEDNRSQAVKWVADAFEIDEDDVAKQMPRLRFPFYFESEAFEDVADWMLDADLLSKSPNLDFLVPDIADAVK